MIYFLHGDNQTSSRQKLIELIDQAKQSKKEIIRFDGLTINFTQLIQALESSSLFGQEKLVIIENLFSRPASKEKTDLTNYLKNTKIDPELILWEKKSISGTMTRWLPKNWHYEIFKTPAIIFKFLDSIQPDNTTLILKLLKTCLQKDTPEMIFYMLVRRIRELIIARDLGKEGLKGAPWQVGKLISQAKHFSLKQLTINYKQLLEVDINIKTGRSFMPLFWHLDLFIANL